MQGAEVNLDLSSMRRKLTLKNAKMSKEKKAAKKYVKRSSSVSVMQGAMRSMFVRAVHKALKTGQWKSKVLKLFKVIDIITTKCFVVVPRREIALDAESNPVKLLLKIVKREDIENYCGTTEPDELVVNKIMDDWVFMSPTSPQITKAYAIYRDGGASVTTDQYMQLTQFHEGYENMYLKVRDMKLKDLSETIPVELHKSIYQFIIQISSAFECAHASNLTHGKFDLTQVVADEHLNDFKIVNLRPWLLNGRQYPLLDDQKVMSGKKERLRYSKALDLYYFGVAIFELMFGKDSEFMVIAKFDAKAFEMQEELERKKRYTHNFDKDDGEALAQIVSAQKRLQHGSMPPLDSIPLGWIKLQQIATLLQIMHICMLIETQRDTVKLFQQIRRLATETYKRFYDSAFIGPMDVDQISMGLQRRTLAASMNNRAVLTRPKLETPNVNKRVDQDRNAAIYELMREHFVRACKIYPECFEARYNLILLKWKNGEIFDERVCQEIKEFVTDRLTAQLMIMTFRKAIGLPIIGAEERKLTYLREGKQKGTMAWSGKGSSKSASGQTALQGRLFSKYHEFQKQGMELGQNMFTHLTTLINDTPLLPEPQISEKLGVPGKSKMLSILGVKRNVIPEKENVVVNENQKKVVEPSLTVKKMFFSQNEQFLVIITENQAVVVQICDSSFEKRAVIDLPQKEVIEEKSHCCAVNTQSEQSSPRSVRSNESGESQRRSSSIAKVTFDQDVKGVDHSVDEDSMTHSKMSGNSDSEQNSALDASKLEKKKEAHDIHCKKFSIGSGYFSSEWLVAIDNTGTKLALHDTAHTKTRVWEQYMNVDDMPYMSLTCEVHVYHGKRLETQTTLQMGNILRDEIFEMIFDDDTINSEDLPKKQQAEKNESCGTCHNHKETKIQENDYESQSADNDASKITLENSPRQDSFFKTTKKSIESSQFPVISSQVNLRSNQRAADLKLDLEGISNPRLNSPWNSNFGTDEFMTSRIKNDSERIGGPQISMPFNSARFSQGGLKSIPSMQQLNSPQETEHKCCTPPEVITFHCKDLYSYKVDASDEMYSNQEMNSSRYPAGYNSSLMCEPTRLLSGATIPVSIFREQVDHNDPEQRFIDQIEKKNKKGKKRKQSKVVNSLRKRIQASMTTNIFSDKVDKECPFGGFKTQHFEHLKEFIESHELAGNLVKLPRFNTSYVVIYQSKRCKDFQPHFQIYDIAKRRIVRRFLPLSPDFSLNWQEAQITSRGRKKREEDNSSSNSDHEEAQTVSCFEVSPKGTFLVAVLPDSEMFSLKYLPEGMIADFKDSVQPFYYCEISDNEYKKEARAIQGVGQKDCEHAHTSESSSEERYQNTAEEYYSRWGLSYRLARLYARIINWQGTTQERHRVLYSYHKSVKKAMAEPQKLYLKKSKDEIERQNACAVSHDDLIQMKIIEAQKKGVECTHYQEQTSPTTMSRCFSAIRYFNHKFSKKTVLTEATGMHTFINDYSEKKRLKSLEKMSLFDQIQFGRSEDKIRFFAMSSTPDSNYIAVFFRRHLQIYDMASAEQIFEAYLPMCRSLQFMNNDNLLVAQDGDSQVFVCAVESQRSVFKNKGQRLSGSKEITFADEDKNQRGFQQYTMGIVKQRQYRLKHLQSQQYNNSDSEEEERAVKLTKAIDIIRNDEDIKELVLTKTTAHYSYIGIIDKCKITVYLIQNEDNSVTYDKTYQFDFWKLNSEGHNGMGRSIMKMDFTETCEEYVGLTSNLTLALFSLVNPTNVQTIYKLQAATRPIDFIKSVGPHCTQVLTCSYENQTLLIVKNQISETVQAAFGNRMANMRRESEKNMPIQQQLITIDFRDGKFDALGKLTSLQVEHARSFIICSFDNNKLALFSMSTGEQVIVINAMAGISFKNVYIDELSTFMCCLDASGTFLHILAFQWVFTFNRPGKTQKTLIKGAKALNAVGMNCEMHRSDKQRDIKMPISGDSEYNKSKTCVLF